MSGVVKVEMPVVSIIVPVFNVIQYLPQCLESVLQQTYQNIEIILIDDGSADGSGSICDEYAQKDVRIRVLHTENRGLASARNTGLAYARGKYISFVDSDDWIELRTIDTLLKNAVKLEADVVIAQKSTEYVSKTVHACKQERKIQILRGNEILLAYAKGRLGDAIWNKLYRIDCFEEIHFPDGHNYEDVVTTPMLMQALAKQNGKVVILSDELFHFRKRYTSISNTLSLNNIADYWNAYCRKYEIFPEYRPYFLSGCYLAIGRMWMTYSSFTKEEKLKATDIIEEMHAFSKAHYNDIMSGRNSKLCKCVCLVSQSRLQLVMQVCYCVGKIRRAAHNLKYKMYE